MIDKIKAEHRIASDSNKYLIALFQHLQDGGELPEHITREEYNKVREAYKWSRHNNIVLISELQAPDDFITIWEKEVDRSMKAKEHFRATEKLFMWGGNGK